MGQKQQQPNPDPLSEPKKKRRVGFSNIDAGVEPNDCIKIFLVSRKEEVGTSDGFCISPVDLNSFFEEDGKIYGYQGLKINIWVSSISFHAHADINFQGTSDGGKGMTDLKSALEVVRLVVGNLAAGHLYSCLVPLVLLLVDALYRFYRYPDASRLRLSQVYSLSLSLFRFFFWQILVLPPYQHKGYGSYLVEVLSNVAISENIYDLTVEEPLDYFQHVRTSFDVKRLLAFDPAQSAVKSAVLRLKQGKLSKKTHVPRFLPPPDLVEDVRKTLKINKKQFLQCWEILIYLGLDPVEKHMEDYVAIIWNRVKADILGKDCETAGKQVIEVPSAHDEEMSFVMFRSQNSEVGGVQMHEDQTKTQGQQLQLLVDERIKEVKLIAEKVSQKHV
ncbi:hypothetical protein CRYUN_Cryun02cG0014700 [Craigia yunnanensis]